MLTVLLTCWFIDSSLQMRTPRSRETLTGDMMSDSTWRSRSRVFIFLSLSAVPNKCPWFYLDSAGDVLTHTSCAPHEHKPPNCIDTGTVAIDGSSYICPSSAYRWWSMLRYWMTAGRSSIYVMNFSAPSTEPWGTLQSTLYIRDKTVPTWNVCVYFARYKQYHWSAMPLIPKRYSGTSNSIPWSTVSNAARKVQQNEHDDISSCDRRCEWCCWEQQLLR